jgi:hypothetical protein
MKVPAVDFVRSREIKQSFRRFGDDYAGELLVEIPVGLDTGPLSTSPGVLKVRVTIDDRMKKAKRDRHVFPPLLPLPDDWPFSWRVETVEADAGFFDVPEAVVARATGGEGSGLITSVTIQVFALPGVQVTVAATDSEGAFQMLDPLEQESGPLRLKVKVERLCRPESLPVPGTPLVNMTLYPGHPVDALEAEENAERRALGHFFVQHVENGVDFMWAATQQTLSIRYNRNTRADSGIAYYFNPRPELPRHGDFLDYEDLLHILLVGEGHEVHVTRPVNPRPEDFTGAPRRVAAFLDGPESRIFFADPLAWGRFVELHKGGGAVAEDKLPELWRLVTESRFFRLRQLASFDDLPPYGAPFAITAKEDIAKQHFEEWLREKPGPFEAFAKLAIDLGIGFVPIVGDAADFAELNLALATGKDRWGEEVKDWELVLMGLAIIPVLGSLFPIARRVGRLL